MSVRSFIGASVRQAMRQVRDALGEDALILRNRNTDSGVEILAMSGDAPELASRDDGEWPPHNRVHGGGCRSYVEARLLAAGMGHAVADGLLRTLPPEAMGCADADAWLHRQLVARLHKDRDDDASCSTDGILALLGTTGAGKTTTAAKLAAGCVRRLGSAQVALVSADYYRVGAQDQLRSYAELLGVDFFVLEAHQPLAALAPALAGKSTVIVDTAGMGQRDSRLLEQITQLQDHCVPVRYLLLLNAAADADALENTAVAYREAARGGGAEISGAVLTKIDEAARIGPALAVTMRHGLRLDFVSEGQRVPEDLHVADQDELIRRALSALPADEPATVREAGDPLGRGLALQTALTVLRDNAPGFARLEALWLGNRVEEAGFGDATGLLWMRDRRQAQPLALDAAGLSLGFPPGPGAAGERIRAELLPALPNGSTWLTMADDDRVWATAASRNLQVWCQGRRRALADLAGLAPDHGTLLARQRGRPVQLRLASLPVAIAVPGARFSGLCLAWFGELYHLENGRPLGRRFWLAPASADQTRLAPLLVAQLGCEGLAALSGRAESALATLRHDASLKIDDVAEVSREMAAFACRLDVDDSDWSVDARGHLLGYLPGRPRRCPQALLDGLLHLLGSRDALRRLALAVPAESRRAG